MDRELFASELSDLATIMFRLERSVSQHDIMDGMRGLSGIQLQTMMLLKKVKRINMTELAGYMFMSRQQLTKTIDSLTGKELVVRGTDPDNRRHVMIELSEKGNAIIEEFVLSRMKIISGMLSVLGEEDAEKMLGALKAIREVLSNYENQL